MQIEPQVQQLISKVPNGDLDKYLDPLEGTHFGIYVPLYEESGAVKMMLAGYSQTERNLVVSVSKKVDDPEVHDALQVAWLRAETEKDSTCKHGGETRCSHCTTHDARCRHCSHPNALVGDLDAPELDYHKAVEGLQDKKELLKSLAEKEFGLALLHGHNEKCMFTRLPEGYVSVIARGVTSFRREADVLADPTFVPNVWRPIGGQWRIAGGFSEQSTK